MLTPSGGPIDKTPDAVFQEGYIEIDEQRQLASRKPQVRQRLGLMDWRQSIDELDLYNYRLLHQQIHSVTTFELDLFVNEWHGFLLFDDKSSFSQFVGQTCHISRLEQSGTQHPMNLDRCANDGLRDLVQPVSRRVIEEREFNTEGTKKNSRRSRSNRELSTFAPPCSPC